MNERTKEGISLTVIDTMPILGTHFLRRHVPSGPFSMTMQVSQVHCEEWSRDQTNQRLYRKVFKAFLLVI